MTDAPSKSFTSRKLDLQHRICADRRVTDGQFRMFVRVLRAMNALTGVAVIGDETIMAEVPSCSSPSTCRLNRKRLADLGYWEVTSGRGATTTEYRIDLGASAAIVAGLEQQRAKRIAKRRRDHQEWRARVAARKAAERHGDAGLPPYADPYRDSALRAPSIDHAEPYRHAGAVPHGDSAQSRMQERGYTFIGTPSPETPSFRAADESVEQYTREADPPGVVIPSGVLSRLGGGDVAEGRRLAQFVPSHVLAEILETAAAFGASRCAEDIAEAREIALTALAQRATA